LTAVPAVPGQRLETAFFERSVHEVAARAGPAAGSSSTGSAATIVETESYERDDPACHAYVGLTGRTEVLFGPPGRAYVYLSYGIHCLLNSVAEPEGEAAAVLIRALEPTAGLEQMRAAAAAPRRPRALLGPGKLTEALGIGLDANGADLAATPFLLLPPRAGRRGRRPARGSASPKRSSALALLRRRQAASSRSRGR
jgi:DNA-3-methyladenine glycosylase